MWDRTLIKLLLKKIRAEERKIAEQFIDNTFKKFQSFYEDDNLPLELSFGLVIKLYTKYADAKNDTILLQDFARDLFTLSVVYGKYVEDGVIYNSDYLPIFSNPKIFKVLALEDEVKEIFEKLKGGAISFSYKPPKDEEFPLSSWEMANVIMINRLEKQLLAEIQFCLTINLQTLLRIIKNYCSIKLHQQVYNELIIYINQSPTFDKFLENLRRQIVTMSLEEKLKPPTPIVSNPENNKKRPLINVGEFHRVFSVAQKGEKLVSQHKYIRLKEESFQARIERSLLKQKMSISVREAKDSAHQPLPPKEDNIQISNKNPHFSFFKFSKHKKKKAQAKNILRQ